MLKSNVIAQCLLNSCIVQNLQIGLLVVQQVFAEHFQDQSFSDWNTQISDKTAQLIIKNVGRSMQINVRQFIANLGSNTFDDATNPQSTSSEDALIGIDTTQSSLTGDRFNGRT